MGTHDAVGALVGASHNPLSGGRFWCPPDEASSGAIVRPRRRRITPHELARAMPLREPQHFRWLAAWQLGATYHTIAEKAGLLHRRSGVDGVPIVREACHRLAALIELPLRSARLGRPRK